MRDIPELIDALRTHVRDLEEAASDGFWHKASVFAEDAEAALGMVKDRLTAEHQAANCAICRGNPTADEWDEAGFYSEDMA